MLTWMKVEYALVTILVSAPFLRPLISQVYSLLVALFLWPMDEKK